MKLPPLSRQQVRAVDRIAIEEYGIPGIVLMENAGRGAAEAIHRLAPNGVVVIVAGKGNNAGDGYVIARHLQLLQREVHVVSLVDPATLGGDALINAEVAAKSEIDIVIAVDPADLQRAIAVGTVIVDCILGTGATGPLRDPLATAVDVANQLEATRIAIDVPTGLDCDSGDCGDPTFRANHTLTFVAPKLGFDRAKAQVGDVEVISIGVPRRLLLEIADSRQ